MRVIFCGSGDFAAPSLEALLASGHEVALIVTPPPKPAGRKRKLKPTRVAEIARAHDADLLECRSINKPESIERLVAADYDVMVVAEFGQLIRKPARDTAKRSCFNLHGSILPELRGAAPVNWAIIRGYERTGVTTFELVDEMDAGAVYRMAETDIGPDETAGELKVRLGELGAPVVLDTLADIEAGLAPVEQEHNRATLAPLMTKADGNMDFTRPARELANLVRGTNPWPGAHAMFRHGDGKVRTVTVWQANLAEGDATVWPGVVEDDLCIATGQGRLDIQSIQPAGKKAMPWKDFVNGYRVAPGDAFAAPESLDA